MTALIHAFWCITLRADQIVAGTAINLLGSGITVFLMLRIWNQSGQTPSMDVYQSSGARSAFWCLLAFAMVPVIWWVLNRTKAGLHIRAAGEQPQAAESVGIDVNRYRYICVVVSGILAGFGGVVPVAGELSGVISAT